MKPENEKENIYFGIYKKNKALNYFVDRFVINGYFAEKDVFYFIDYLILKSFEYHILEFLKDCKLYLGKISNDLSKNDIDRFPEYEDLYFSDELREYDMKYKLNNCFNRNHFFDCFNHYQNLSGMNINNEFTYPDAFKELLYFRNKEINKLKTIINNEIKIYNKLGKEEYIKYFSDTDIEYKLKHEKDFELLNKNEIINSQRKHFNYKYIDYYKEYEKILNGKSKITSDELSISAVLTSEKTDQNNIKPFPAFVILSHRNRNNMDFKLIFPDLDILDKDSLYSNYRKFYRAKHNYDNPNKD